MEKWVCHSWHVLLSPNVWRNFSLFLSFSASTIFFTHPSQETDSFHSMETGNIPGQSWLAESWAQGSVSWNKWRLSTSPSDVYCFVIRQLLCFGCTWIFFFFFDCEKVFHFFWDNLGQQAASFLTYIICLLQNHAMLPLGQDPGAVVAVPPNAVAPAISQQAAVGILFPFAFAPPPHNILPQFPVNCPDFSTTCQNITPDIKISLF